MKLGKLSVMVETHPTLGEILVIRGHADDGIFDINGDHLTLRISKDTALKLVQFVDEEMEVNGTEANA